MIDKLRELTDKGLLTHLSVYAQWGAHNSPTVFHAACVTPHGQGHSDNVDIVAAILEAIDNAPKERQRHTPVVYISKAPISGIGSMASPPEASTPLAPAPVRGQPVKPAKAQQTTGKPRQGRDLTTTPLEKMAPNLMDLFK